MKKVLYLTTVSRTINAFLVPHINMLLNEGYKVDMACSIDKEVDESLLNRGCKLYSIPFSRSPLSLGNLKAFKELLKLQKENNYDIIHVHTPVASIFGRLVKLRYPKVKTIYTAHGYHFLKGGSKAGWILYYPIEKIMAKLTDVTININSEDYEITKTKLKPKKAYFVRGVGLDLTQYKPLSKEHKEAKRKELNLDNDDFVIIMIAELNENKNQIQLIKAMEIVAKKHSNVKAILVGEGNKKEELQIEINNRGLENNIKLLGFRTDINELINISNIGVLLSYREGLPRNIMELMANGKKVIATNIRGNRDLIENENVGSLVNVGDYEALAKEIENYIMQNNYRGTNSENEIVPKEIEKYDVKSINGELVKIYKEV